MIVEYEETLPLCERTENEVHEASKTMQITEDAPHPEKEPMGNPRRSPHAMHIERQTIQISLKSPQRSSTSGTVRIEKKKNKRLKQKRKMRQVCDEANMHPMA